MEAEQPTIPDVRQPMAAARDATLTPRQRRIVWLSLATGAVLFVIGFRFWFMPAGASATFGVPHAPTGTDLYRIIAMRDFGLGALVVAFALMCEWRALAVWFLTCACVCAADTAIVAAATANPYPIAFHVASAIFCLLLARGAWAVRPRSPI